MTDPTKFIAGSLQALSAMVQLEVPHINLLTKIDLCPDKVPCNCCALDDPEHVL